MSEKRCPAGSCTKVLQRIQQQAGFIEFSNLQFAEAEELFQEGGLDVRELISLYPELLPASSNFERASPKLHDIDDVVQMCDGDKDKVAKCHHFLASYLETTRQLFSDSRMHSQLIRPGPAAPPACLGAAGCAPAARKTPPSDSRSLHKALKLQLRRPQIDSLQAKLQALEEKLESAITVKSSLPSPSAPPPTWTFRLPKDAMASASTQHSLESLTFLKRSRTSPPNPPPRPFQSLQSTVDSLQTAMLGSIRAKPPLHARTTTSSGAARTSQTPAEATSSAVKMADRSIVTIWQWNCRGFRPKRNHLLLHLQQLDPSDAPDIIVLQETHADVSLSGYVAYNQVTHHPLPHPVTAVLTRRTLAVNRHDLPFPAVHHVFLETLPQQREQPSLFILNVYNPPRSTEDASLLALLRAAAAKAAKSPLLILGDFNIKHPDWGYSKADGPGRRLWQLAHDLNLSLLTDPTQPTRIGNSVCRDTTPDLSFCRSVPDARWYNTHQSLGSDHYVLTIQVLTSPSKPRPHTARYTDWDAFRERRLHSATSNIEDLSTWTDQLLADLDAVTASIPTTKDYPATDARLAHLWAARTGLCNRWQKQRHNRRLRRRIAHLDRTIEQHTTALARQQWEQLCSGLSGQLGCKQSWHLLRHLLDPASAKLVARQQLQRVVRAYPGDTPSLMADLSAKYLQLLPPGTPPPPLASLPKRSEIAWRRLQTRTFPCPLVFSYMHPGAIDPRCCLCGNVASLNHILWGCPEDPPPADLLCSPPTEGQWEALLSSNDIDIQTRVLKRAEEVIEKHSLAAFVA
ncbi:hypothetical protein HPB51_007848 [Rhipicephalus microplus]|uniref:Endonuclease/exonuclease/phosphatase domain-containing protein n=1 Tax=Rhipicephalus microplus TaxID=6941 RepID=A0A9J6ENF1_RHIMP|nr:hypothetical protein HPB51_007848 [Rhipicephalus microplus]